MSYNYPEPVAWFVGDMVEDDGVDDGVPVVEETQRLGHLEFFGPRHDEVVLGP